MGKVVYSLAELIEIFFCKGEGQNGRPYLMQIMYHEQFHSLL